MQVMAVSVTLQMQHSSLHAVGCKKVLADIRARFVRLSVSSGTHSLLQVPLSLFEDLEPVWTSMN